MHPFKPPADIVDTWSDCQDVSKMGIKRSVFSLGHTEDTKSLFEGSCHNDFITFPHLVGDS